MLSTQRTSLRTKGSMDQRMQLTDGSYHLKIGLSSEQTNETSLGAKIPRSAR